MNWEVLLAMCIWDFTCVGNCSECVSCQTLKSFQLEIERRKIVTTSGISKMPNIYIQSVKSILPTHELSTSNGQKTMSQMADSLLSCKSMPSVRLGLTTFRKMFVSSNVASHK